MTVEQTKSDKKQPILRRLIIFSSGGIAVVVALFIVPLLYNNISIKNDQRFTKALNPSRRDAMLWAVGNERNLLGGVGYINIALLRMLQDCNELRYTKSFDKMIHKYMACKTKPKFKKAILDPDWPIDKVEINEVFNELVIDYQWETYVVSPDKVSSSPEELDLFNPDRWQGRQLTHQLWALILHRERNKCGPEMDDLIEHLCDRLASELCMDIAVVDIYIQKVAFILKAGHPEKINRRWIERIIDNQNIDGGWDDRWFCFTSGRRPRFEKTKSNQHATIQALWVLYQVKYRYPEIFGVQTESKE